MAYGTGIGIGIGQGLERVGDVLEERRQEKIVGREKQADALHQKGLQIGTNLLNSGFKIAKDPNTGQPALFDLKTNQLAQNPSADVLSMQTELMNTSKQLQDLFPPHEQNAFAKWVGKAFGKQPGQPTPDPRAAGFSAENISAEVPIPAQKPEQFTGEFGQRMQALRVLADPKSTPEQKAQAQKFLDELDRQTKGGEGQWKESGDPYLDKTTGRYYQNWIDSKDPGKTKTTQLPAHFQPKGTIKTEQDAAKEAQREADIEKRGKEKAEVTAKLEKEKEAEREKLEQTKFEHAKELQQSRLNAAAKHQSDQLNVALDKKDYADAKKIVNTADNAYEDAIDRMATMDKNLEDGLGGNQQAMLSLVANHIGMTLGAQKGARINQAVWNEAIASAPWLERAQAHFGPDGFMLGVTLTPEQMHQMVDLAHQKVDILHEHKRRDDDKYHAALSVGTRDKKPTKEEAPPKSSDKPTAGAKVEWELGPDGEPRPKKAAK